MTFYARLDTYHDLLIDQWEGPLYGVVGVLERFAPSRYEIELSGNPNWWFEKSYTVREDDVVAFQALRLACNHPAKQPWPWALLALLNHRRTSTKLRRIITRLSQPQTPRRKKEKKT